MTVKLDARSMKVSLQIAAVLTSVIAITLPATIRAKSPEKQGPIMIQRQGSFTAGGKVIGDATTGTLHCDHGLVDFQIPVRPRKMALFLWHSSSAQIWQQRWDGGEGYQDIFLRRGFPIYIWDGPRVGRGNMSCESYSYAPFLGLDQRNFVAWRFGPSPGKWFPGVQFPTKDPAALEQAMRARYYEFDTEANARLEADAAAKAIDRIGPTVLVTNSGGILRVLLAAIKSDNVKAIVAYDAPAFVFAMGTEPKGAMGTISLTQAEFDKLARIPIQLVWGDNIDSDFWRGPVAISRKFVEAVNARGGRAEILNLPNVGLKGNTHIAFADLNNVEVADQLSKFLKRNGLDKR